MTISMSQLASRYAMAAGRVDPVVAQELDKFATVGRGLVKKHIRRHHAVDTGVMLNSTTSIKKSPKLYLIGPTVNYAPYVALGTSRMAARPFHMDAAAELNATMKSKGFTGKLKI